MVLKSPSSEPALYLNSILIYLKTTIILYIHFLNVIFQCTVKCHTVKLIHCHNPLNDSLKFHAFNMLTNVPIHTEFFFKKQFSGTAIKVVFSLSPFMC